MPTAPEDSRALRQSIIDACLEMNRTGINQGTSGNISLRLAGEEMLITPSGVPYEQMTPDMIVRMPLSGDLIRTMVNAPRRPSGSFTRRLWRQSQRQWRLCTPIR